MENGSKPTPKQFKGVMISSTFEDLKEHREALNSALRKSGLMPITMEDSVPGPNDNVLSSSLQMVHDSSAYIGLISHRYGQVLDNSEKNPQGLSITQLEYDEAQRLKRPTLIFIMGDEHAITKKDIEPDPEKQKKLDLFREQAKQNRLYEEFDSVEEFTQKAIHTVAKLAKELESQNQSTPPITPPINTLSSNSIEELIPTPPHFYAEPPYIGSHPFIGRQSQLDTLNDWANPANPHPVLLFEAIGGTGKSILTWEWINHHATRVRNDWAGRFWYSFYEKGADMSDFCARLLAYITGNPLKELKKKKTIELTQLLLPHLKAKPWLIVGDGLERVLVAYHRLDAAQLRDEEAGTTDIMANRDPCAAIRPEDDDLLVTLVGTSPSKILFTSRLTPAAILNPSNQPINGVLKDPLLGFRPKEAEEFIRACGVTGDSLKLQDYLQRHCDCHPLVIGVLAGLITSYLPDRGNFDAWENDLNGGGRLNLAHLDLVQKRNHIIEAALETLDKKSLQLLSTLALLSETVDYETLKALNPYLPTRPEVQTKPKAPQKRKNWENYQAELEHYLKLRETTEFLSKLEKSILAIERRGLLQYDLQKKRYDLHPVVRGYATGRLEQNERENYGQRVVDHFSQKASNPYQEAESLDELKDGINLVRTLQYMGRYKQAYQIFNGDLSTTLMFRFGAYKELLSLVRPFFSNNWETLPDELNNTSKAKLINTAANSLSSLNEPIIALNLHEKSMQLAIQYNNSNNAFVSLRNIFLRLVAGKRLADAAQCIILMKKWEQLVKDEGVIFRLNLGYFSFMISLGQMDKAEALWQCIAKADRNLPLQVYRPGSAERLYLDFLLKNGNLTEKKLEKVRTVIFEGKSIPIILSFWKIQGQWLLQQKRYKESEECWHQLVSKSHERGERNTFAETNLARAKHYLGTLNSPYIEAERLSKLKEPSHYELAELWHTIGNFKQAKHHALEAYKKAWADGEPYVFRYELNQATALLKKLEVTIPDLPPYDPAKAKKLTWFDKIEAFINQLEEKQQKEAEKEQH